MGRTEHSRITAEFEGVELGDRRRNARLLLLAERLAEQPDASFPDAMSNEAELEAAYRFFNNVKVEAAEILRPHVRQTVERAKALPVALVAHDSSTVSFDSEYREGLTRRGSKQHFIVHCSLAMHADGSRRPLGLLAMSQHLPVSTMNKALQDRWAEHVREVHAHGLSPDNVVHLMDREGDDYEVLDLLKRLQTRFVLRVQHNRVLKNGTLRDSLANTQLRAEREVELSRRTAKESGPKQSKIHPPRENRLARLAIAAGSVTIPRSMSAKSSCAESLSLNVVRVWEPSPPEGQAPVEWLLYTSEPIETPEQILQVVDWYRARWTIEEYYKALKTGCALEKRQLGDLHALSNALALLAPIAWQLLLLKTESRVHPDAPATSMLDEDELRVLRLVSQRRKLPDNPTMLDAMLAIAGLGGHLKHNGPPGWITLARGYEKLRNLTTGLRLAQST
ncbi:MAG TPA: IS4 family transposase [Polyangiaceae bacterium]|nr:IS4 family transposase [Polyangiaceae bacterium]